MPMKLGVNIDHVATLRQARGAGYPAVEDAAELALQSGADFIVAHLRGDRRHMQDDDIKLLAARLRGKLHLEMACTPEMEKIALKVKPGYVCLVPEKKSELTTNGGLILAGKQGAEIGKTSAKLHKKGIGVSLFIEPDPHMLRQAHKLGATAVEFCTKSYSESSSRKVMAERLEELALAAVMARELGLEAHAGHGLDYDNVVPVAGIADITALNIGFSIIARAISTGLPDAVREMKELMS